MRYSLKKPIISRITLAAFSIYLLCIIIPVATLSIISAVGFLSDRTASYMQTKARQSLQITETFKNQLDLMQNTSTHMSLSWWTSRVNNHIGLYDEEFDLAKRLMIIDEVRAQVQPLEFVTDVFVVLPNKRIVITDDGWFSRDDITKYYPYLAISDAEAQNARSQPYLASSTQPDLLPLIYQSPASSSSDCFVILVVDTKRIERFLVDAALEQYKGFRVSRNDDTLSSWGTLHGQDLRLIMYETNTLPQGFHIEMSYAPYSLQEGANNYALSFAAALAVLLAGSFVAGFLAHITTKPVNSILRKLSQTKLLSVKQSYKSLPEYVDSMISNNSYLTQQLEHYGKIVRSESLFRLLTDEATAGSTDEYMEELIPWRKKGLPYHVLLLVKKQMLSSAQEAEMAAFLCDISAHLLAVPIPNCDAAYVLWYDNDAQHKARTSIQERFQDLWFLAFSDNCEDFARISALYAQAREQLDKRMIMGGAKQSAAIPLSNEVDLINAIYGNSPSQCLAILKKIWRSGGNEVAGEIMMLLVRLSNERFIYCQEFVDRYNMQVCMNRENAPREVIQEFCEHLCSEVNKAKTLNQWDMANLIQKYVRDNYCDSNLSLKLLADVFHINVSLLSRLYKSHFDMNFSDYLMEMRMNRAEELLRKRDLSIAELSKQIGYENYLSFKRAFIRSKGVSPREYRELHIKNEV